ncbi:MAG: NUDIX domain-containing protein [Planctomycetales bacterium]|nr:NUDIX domain-containing protein [Planctomycetales bacterium]
MHEFEQTGDDIARRGVVAVVVRKSQLLVIRRSQHVIAPGLFCFPGGGIEAGESEPEALIREMQEELSVAVRPVRRLWRSVTPWRIALAWWHAELEPTAICRANPAEVESVHWHSVAELASLPDLLPSNRDFLAALDRGEIQLPASSADAD